MSSFYDDASLVVIPSGYKTSKVYAEKPTDGSGDLTFTRTGDTATRVNSAGLIERVRTNRVLQSQTFDNASWLKYNATVTANTTTAPDGTTTADSLTDNATNDLHITYQSLALTAGENTISCYAKANTLSHLSIYVYDGANFFSSGIFNVSNGTVSGAGSITAAGNGWYRLSFTATIATGSGNVYIALSNGSTISYAGTGQSLYIWGYQAETGVATAYIPTTTAAVSVGPVANVPRLDYLGSTCPRLLLEPQRTNLTQYSEQLNNAYWTKSGGTITANSTASPDGYVNADLFTESATTADHAIYDVVNYFVSGTTYTASFFVKANGRTKVELASANSNTCPLGRFDLIAKTATAVGDSFNAKIEEYGNGWFRCSVSRVAPNSGLDLPYYALSINTGVLNYAGNGTSGMYFWGMQMEAGAYATSYIPTLAASATRGADACSKTGISSLIGQTEGVMYSEFQYFDNIAGTAELVPLYIGNGAFTAGIYFSVYQDILYAAIWDGAVQQALINCGALTAGVHKIAIAYKQNDIAVYLNGVLKGTDTSATIPTCAQVFLGTAGSSTTIESYKTLQALLFKTRLSNASLAELTTL